MKYEDCKWCSKEDGVNHGKKLESCLLRGLVMERINYGMQKISFWGSPKFLFHPVTAFLIGFLAYHLIPPFFSEDGHNWFVILLDIFAIVFFAIGVGTARIFKTAVFGSSFKIRVGPEDFKLMLFVWFCYLFSLRAFHYYEAGIYSLLHPYSTQCHTYTTMKGQLTDPFNFLLWYGAIALKKRYCFLLLFIEFLIGLPIMSRAFIFYFVVHGMIVYVYINGLSKRMLKRFSISLILLFVTVGLFGGLIHAARSYVYIGQLDKVWDRNIYMGKTVSLGNAARFLGQRMNIHGNYKKFIEGHEDYVANRDLESLKSILPKLLGFEKEYKVGPGISMDIGTALGFAKTHSAFEWPRPIILYHLPGGILAIGIFYMIFGAIFGSLFYILYSSRNLLFPMIYVSMALMWLYGGSASHIGITAFQLLFKFVTLFFPFGIFFCLKMLKMSVRPQLANVS